MGALADWQYENAARAEGFCRIAGVDEAGRGPLAGPVVAAAVVLANGFDADGITDSKKLSKKRRRCALEHIMADAVAVGVGVVGSDEIDRINILQATHLAMKYALKDLGTEYDYVLVDGLSVPGLAPNCQAIVKGDSKSVSIAAASIVAKVTRDELMSKYHSLYPEYGFSNHCGYATKEHLEAIEKYGPCPIHRMSFAPLRQEVSNCVLPGLD